MSVFAPVGVDQVRDLEVAQDRLTLTVEDGRRIRLPAAWLCQVMQAGPTGRDAWETALADAPSFMDSAAAPQGAACAGRSAQTADV